MEVLLFIGIIIGILVIVGIAKGSNRGSAIGASMGQAINNTGKIKFTIDWLTQNLDAEKLAGTDKKYAQYYIAYLDEIARAMCQKDGAEYDDGNRFLIYHEAQRLLSESEFEDDPSLTKSKALLSEVFASEAGEQGRQDGRKDGAYVVELSNHGPYYNLARAYFGLPPAEKREA